MALEAHASTYYYRELARRRRISLRLERRLADSPYARDEIYQLRGAVYFAKVNKGTNGRALGDPPLS
jgi:hypothetical protein